MTDAIHRRDPSETSGRPGGDGDHAPTLADQIEALPLSNAAEVLNWLAPHLERLRSEAERILAAQP